MIQVEVYKQERNVLAGQLAGASYVILAVSGVTFTYLCDSGGNYKIDITDIVRTMPNTVLDVIFYNSGGTILEQRQYELQVKGLVNPQNYFAPPVSNIHLQGDVQNGELILPPSHIVISGGDMLEMYNATAMTLQAECIYIDMDNAEQTAPLVIAANILFYQVGGLMYYPERIHIYDRDYPDVSYVTQVQLPVCGVQYARVEWISRLGTLKSSVWEVERRTDVQTDTYSLWDMQNAYNYHTGREEELTLVQRDLNAYDYWYWSDIVTSSDVRVSLNMLSSYLPDIYRVQVKTKEVTVPNGNGGKSTLKVTIRYRRYDAI